MLLIVSHHLVLYATNYSNLNTLNISSIFLKTLLTGGKLGVILFILITGYFSTSKNYNLKKILSLIIHTFFYSLIFLLVGLIFNKDISIKILLKSIFPVTFNQYWFVSSYVVLFLLIPFLNKLISNLSKREYLYFLIIMSLFINILPSITLTNFPINNIGYLIYIYFLGGYLKLYGKSNQKKFQYLITSLIFYIIPIILTIILELLALKINFLSDKIYNYLSLNSIFLYISAISLFMFFKNIKINSKFNKVILFFSTTTFGVYLIHENHFIRDILWKNFFNLNNITNFSTLFCYSLLIIILVYVVCSIVDYLYQKIIAKKLENLLSKGYDYIIIKFKKIIKRRISI